MLHIAARAVALVTWRVSYEYDGNWCANQNERQTHTAPGAPPADGLDRLADCRERDDESDAHEKRIEAHRLVESSREPLSNQGKAHDRQCALTETARQCHRHPERRRG